MKMLQTLTFIGVLLGTPMVASAGGYGTAGCGLGGLVFGDAPGMIQIVASTLNVTGYQTLAITTGTSGCTEDAATAALDQELFLRTNRAHVMRDAAVGEGEYLETFATLLGCEKSSYPEFFALTKSNHARLFNNTSETQILTNVKVALAHNQSLANACQRI